MTTRIIIVRHGQSSYNSQGKIQGRSNLSVLTQKGQADALKVGLALKEIPIQAIYASPLQRASLTAEIISSCFDDGSVGVKTTGLLMEIDLPLWEMMLRSEVEEKLADDYKCWSDRPHEFKMMIAGGEHYPVLAIFDQARLFWEEVLTNHRGETVLVVAHNGINRALISTALGISPDRYHSILQSNCGISVLNFANKLGDPVQLESLNITSHVGDKLPRLKEGFAGTRLLLVRHGETQWNKEGRFQGQIDVPLNENGEKQAAKVGDFLEDIGLNFAVSSPMLRPKKTAEIILQNHGIDLQFKEDLKEISHGLWEGKLQSEIEEEYPGLLELWHKEPSKVQMPEGENLQQVWDRSIKAWEEVVAENRGVGIVVAHDATNKVILCYLLGLLPEDIWKVKQGNGGITVIDYPNGIGGKPLIQALNLTSHLSGTILDKTAAGAL